MAPEAFMIKDKDYSIISCSPENLITKKNNFITTKPIAGTLKKNKKLNKNKALTFFRKNLKETKEHNMIVAMERNDLSKICKPGSVTILKKNKKLNKNKALTFFRKNLKESKEHNMIVDMERNDLSKICKPGSVKILKKKIVEEYKDLYHYVSLIGGQLKNKVTSLEIIKAMMPGGSVIGCPKISTLNLLNKQEKQSRNIYTGSFGYLKFNGDMRFNIIIRSILNFKGKSEISVASGVVIDSNAAHEFNENYIKAKSLIDLYK
jgi:para-aminobenzoate synthetase component 1